MCPIWTNLQPKNCFEYDQKEFPNVFAMIYIPSWKLKGLVTERATSASNSMYDLTS